MGACLRWPNRASIPTSCCIVRSSRRIADEGLAMQSGLPARATTRSRLADVSIRGAAAGKGLRCWPRTDLEQAFDWKVAAPDQSAWVTVLVILISTAWLAIALFALTMFRLAALSDRSNAVAWADWIAASHLAEHG